MFKDKTLMEKMQNTVRGMSCRCGECLLVINNKIIRANFVEKMKID